MKIYISGISGTGMGPLALMAVAAGHEVCGSDLAEGAIYPELIKAGVEVAIGAQDGAFLKAKLAQSGIDWFVHTSALPSSHPELTIAREQGIKTTKRDELTAFLVDELGLKMVAVAGTHGKTTTTAMIVWACLQLGVPAAYIVGTTLGFAPSGAYYPGDRYFIYEADEYDRNFLKFHPWLAVITTVSYDHPDIYPSWDDYVEAFSQFESQSDLVLDGREASEQGLEKFTLAGRVRREDARLAAGAVKVMSPMMEEAAILGALNTFPGVGRRFERVGNGFYTDYAHHPEEIAATMDIALDECRLHGYKGVVAVYQPHQNTRQHEVRRGYAGAFRGAERIYWLPTYLTREDPALPVLTPSDLISELENASVAEPAELGDDLFANLEEWRDNGCLILLMTAGPADTWLREKLS